MPIPDAAARRFPVWNPSSSLSDRVKRLRDEYFSFDTRSFRNEVMPFSTGTAWDTVFMASRWTIVPGANGRNGFRTSASISNEDISRPTPL